MHPFRPGDKGRLTIPGPAGAASRGQTGAASFLRLLGYARAYAAWIAVGLTLAAVYSGAIAYRSYLMKPLVDDVLLKHPAVHTAPADALGFLPGSEGAAGGEDGAAGAGEGEGGAQGTEGAAGSDAARAEEEARAELARVARENFWSVIYAAILIALVVPVAAFFKDYLVEYTLGRVRVDLQQDVCAQLLALPLDFHHRTRRGDTFSRTMADVNRAHQSLQLLFGDVVQAVLRLAAGGAVLFWISWQLTLLGLLVAPPIAGVVAFFGRRVRRSSLRRQIKIGDVTQRLMQILSGIKVIKAFRGEAHESRAFARENRKLFRREMKVVANRVASRSLVEMLSNTTVVAMIVLGGFLVLNGLWGLSVGDLSGALAVMVTLHRPTKTLAKGWNLLMDALPAADRVFELLDAEAGMQDAPDAVRIDRLREGIRIRKVSFSYGREPVLQDLSLDVRRGEVLAIVGPTGAGKSTLADLLLRFYDPDSGSIEIDGIDLRRIRRDSLLDRIAIVTQEPFLFAGTIRQNVLYGRPGASAEDFEQAVRAAYVDEFATRLPDGYDTEVGEAGGQLSGGQRQRITIARAILKNPSILIFDEATSALDAKSERYVQRAVDSLLGGRTVFVIAHRLSTVRHADRILVLEHGGHARIGTHAELMRSGGLYPELVGLQEND